MDLGAIGRDGVDSRLHRDLTKPLLGLECDKCKTEAGVETYGILALSTPAGNVGPWNNRDSNSHGHTSALQVELRQVHEVQGAGIVDGLQTPRCVEASDFVSGLGSLGDWDGSLAVKADRSSRTI
jgi:hypothetical protein